MRRLWPKCCCWSGKDEKVWTSAECELQLAGLRIPLHQNFQSPWAWLESGNQLFWIQFAGLNNFGYMGKIGALSVAATGIMDAAITQAQSSSTSYKSKILNFSLKHVYGFAKQHHGMLLQWLFCLYKIWIVEEKTTIFLFFSKIPLRISVIS